MSARELSGGGPGFLASALARAEEWLLHPEAEALPRRPVARPAPLRHPVVAVVGLGRRPGASTVARGLAAALAGGSRSRASVLAELSPRLAAGQMPGPGMLAAVRLARSLRPALADPVRCCGRLCVVAPAHVGALVSVAQPLAPLVIDVGHAVSPRGVAALADAVVLVAAPAAQPALGLLSAHSLARVGPRPLIVLNGHDELEPASGWTGQAHALLPRAPGGARLAAAGHEPAGALGAALRELARELAGAVVA